MAHTHKIENIQALRALAAICIVMLHALGTGSHYTTGHSHLIGPATYLAFGVDLFFVISGFVIYMTTMGSNLSAGEFMRRRLLRIVPPYWLLTIVFFSCLLIAPGLNAAATTGWSKFAASLLFGTFAIGTMPVIYPGWTLEYEMCFYALTTLALLTARRRPWALIAVVLCGATLARPWIGTAPAPAVDFLTNSISLSFLAGIVVGQWALNGRPGAIEGFALATALAFVALQGAPQRALYAGLPSALLVYAAVRARPARAYRWLTRLGDASYAIYLLHVFVIAVVGKVSQALLPSLNADLLAFVMMLATVLAGLTFHRWVEHPVGKRLAAAVPGVERRSGATGHLPSASRTTSG
jgi:peptidoglycan/LPS O-acetylase OafA/YrhL